jgi:alpha-beta hydrolase superfamily lysophospholipase
VSEASFSFQALRDAAPVAVPGPDQLTATDGVTLSYRRYLPSAPRSALLFYHGGGAHSAAGYQYLSHGLQTAFDVAVYTPDIRGHGASGGPRGDTPNPQQVWADIATLARRVREDYPTLPLFLGGHSSGAGLMLNYISRPDAESAVGYVFLSPHLGLYAHTERPVLAHPFAVVDGPAFAAYGMSGGREHGHDYAVRFNYSDQMLAGDPGLVGSITVGMSVALMPSSPAEQFRGLKHPFGLWVGAEDELFLPDKVLAFADLATSVRAKSEAAVVPSARHLSILVDAHRLIGPWITRAATWT